MEHYTYLSLIPESLVVSMLAPEEFGRYLAVGSGKRAREQAIFFEVSEFESDYFDIEGAIERCVPHEDGQPKHSVYVSTYRVLEHVPLEAIGNLWLVTNNGLTLELKQGLLPAEGDHDHHLYQELCPVHPLIASDLDPPEFCKFITDPKVGVSVPRICFLELQTGEPYTEQKEPEASNLPYKNIKHLWDCMAELTERDKAVKTVDRINPQHVLYRCTKNGFYIGDHETMLYYPFPSAEELEREHHRWWRWAQLS